jgi:hypothetical protein
MGDVIDTCGPSCVHPNNQEMTLRPSTDTSVVTAASLTQRLVRTPLQYKDSVTELYSTSNDGREHRLERG